MAKIKTRTLLILIIGLIMLTLLLYVSLSRNKPDLSQNNLSSNLPQGMDSFAKCITESGAKMYGTYWCSHCQNQKKMFGDSVQYLPYVECASVSGSSQQQVCSDNGITGYPTWVFGDGTRLSGELSLEVLSRKTGCPLN